MKILFFIRKYLTPHEGRSHRQSTLLRWVRYGRSNRWEMLMRVVNGPDNPRAWDPNDPILSSPAAPHETRATMRMHRAGWPGQEIIKALNVRGSRLQASLTEAMGEEAAAHRAGRPIHDPKVDEDTV